MPPTPRKTTKAVSAKATAPSSSTAAGGQKFQAPKYVKAKPVDGFQRVFDTELKELLDLPPTLSSRATERLDGRLQKIALATIQDRNGRGRAGIAVHLLDIEDNVIDRAYTSRTGLVVLRFPHEHVPYGLVVEEEAEETTGTLRILDGTDKGIEQPVVIPADKQFVDLTVVLEELPQPLTIAAEMDEVAIEIAERLWPPPGLGDDPLTNLPADFTPELCDAIAAKVGEEGDSLLGKVGEADDFRSRRTPLIRRLSVVRNGEELLPNGEPRRYLVRLRQSWIFLGYTLGELAEVDSLDPGELLDETISTVEKSVESVSRAFDQARSFATSSVSDVLSQTNKIDSLIKVATSTEVSAAAGGFFIGIPGLFGAGGVAATAGVSTSARTSTAINTSLNVNHSISTAETFVNEAIRQATSSVTSLARTITSKLNQVSPLLSRVTNLLRWYVYENYAVATHVEDVVELRAVPVLAVPPGGDVFTAADIVEYRRFFEPALLDPRMRRFYDRLENAVQQELTGGAPITSVVFDVAYSASLMRGTLTVEINGARGEVTLVRGRDRARGIVRFASPAPASAVTNVGVTLSGTISAGFNEIISAAATPSLFNLAVTSISLWAGQGPGTPPDHVHDFGGTFQVSVGSAADSDSYAVTIPPETVNTTLDPLYRHVNANPSYYLGVLAQAALLYPSLRTDCEHLEGIPPAVWRLPVLGFEGGSIIVAKDADPESDDVVRLLSDPGAATLIQIAAPGAYSEALQGLLSLVDAETLIHPSLLPPPAPAVPPIGLIDLTGRQLVPTVPSSNGASTPSPGPVLPI